MIRLKKWQTVTATLATFLVLIAAFKQPVYQLIDIQTQSATDSLEQELKQYNDISNQARLGEINMIAQEVAELKQLVACDYWDVPVERCRDFKIPVILPRK